MLSDSRPWGFVIEYEKDNYMNNCDRPISRDGVMGCDARSANCDATRTESARSTLLRPVLSLCRERPLMQHFILDTCNMPSSNTATSEAGSLIWKSMLGPSFNSDKKGRRDGKCILSLVYGHNALLSAEQAGNGDDTVMNLSVSNGYGGMCLSDLSLSRLSSLWESSDGIEPGSFILHDTSDDYAQANVGHKMQF